MKKLVITLFAVTAVMLLSSVKVHAAQLSYTTLAEGADTRYTFNLLNDDQDPYIWELFLNIPVDESYLSSYASPAGWGDGFGGSDPLYGSSGADLAWVEWYADTGKELSKGNSLDGFSFLSSKPVTDPIMFSLNQDVNIVGTAVVTPEPISSVLFLMGGGAIALVNRRKNI